MASRTHSQLKETSYASIMYLWDRSFEESLRLSLSGSLPHFIAIQSEK
jgi:hypothetical protein